MHKDPFYFYFIVPTLLLLLQITVYIVFSTVCKILKDLFKVTDSSIKGYTIPERKDNQVKLLKQGGNDAR